MLCTNWWPCCWSKWSQSITCPKPSKPSINHHTYLLPLTFMPYPSLSTNSTLQHSHISHVHNHITCHVISCTLRHLSSSQSDSALLVHMILLEGLDWISGHFLDVEGLLFIIFLLLYLLSDIMISPSHTNYTPSGPVLTGCSVLVQLTSCL
jgi:hypothetical protein